MYGLSEAQSRKLQRVQNIAARIVTRSSKFDHITPLLRQLHWLPIKARLHFKILLLTFKTVHGLSPFYLRQLLKVFHCERGVRSKYSMMLVAPRIRSKIGEKSFSWAAPYLWNNLPTSVRNIKSLEVFKRTIKTQLFLHYLPN